MPRCPGLAHTGRVGGGGPADPSLRTRPFGVQFFNRRTSHRGSKMSDFVLIDLSSQYEEILRHVIKMKPGEIIEWMHQFGIVRKISHEYDDNLYSFVSSAGIGTVFRFDEDGKLIVFHL